MTDTKDAAIVSLSKQLDQTREARNVSLLQQVVQARQETKLEAEIRRLHLQIIVLEQELAAQPKAFKHIKAV